MISRREAKSSLDIARAEVGSVLLIQPDELASRALVHLLDGAGYRISVARDAESVASQLIDSSFDLVLADSVFLAKWPDEVKSLLHGDLPPSLVVLASSTDPEVSIMALKLGAVGCYSQPFNESELLVGVAGAVMLARRQRATLSYMGQLERKIHEGEDQLRATAKEAERAGRLEKDLLANLSHELRTPLTPIIGYADLMSRMDEISDVEIKRFAQTTGEQGRRLHRLVEALIQAASIRKSEMVAEASHVDTKQLLDEVEGIADMEGRTVKVTICPGSESCVVDATFVRIILRHLMDNAIKFSPEDAGIEVSTHMTDGDVVFSVSDKGQGVPKDLRESMFDCFVQGDSSSTRAYGGLGLGLYICKELVAAQGGSIWVQDRPGGGSSVRFSIPGDPRRPPIASRLEREVERSRPGRGDSGGPKILVVDDDESIRLLLSTWLNLEGLETVAASSVSEARLRMAEAEFGLVLCDVRMPGEPALNLVRDIDEKLPSTEVIIVSGIDDLSFALSTIDLGAFGYVKKPVESDDLMIKVAAALKHKEKTREGRLRSEELAAKLAQSVEVLQRTSEAYQDAHHLALTDELTGLHNYRSFQKQLISELERAARFGQEVSLLMIDIDEFKSFNDRYGHKTGDAVLSEVSRRISEHKRSFDILSRYGGEEFAMILPQTSKDGARALAERVRRAVSAKRFELNLDDPARVTISVGVATFPADGLNDEQLFRAADWALFRAKDRGRDSVVAGGDEQDSTDHE